MKRAVNSYMSTRKTIFVSVTTALAGGTDGVNPLTTSLVNIARGYWRVDVAKARQCELLAAVEKNIIKGVWEIDRQFGWQPMRTVNDISPDRHPSRVYSGTYYCQLLGNMVTDIPIGTEITSIPGMDRMRGPFQYNFR